VRWSVSAEQTKREGLYRPIGGIRGRSRSRYQWRVVREALVEVDALGARQRGGGRRGQVVVDTLKNLHHQYDQL
jgi:hypothetical protein